MVVVMPANRLRQILDIGQLAALRGVRKVGGELVELGCGRPCYRPPGQSRRRLSGSWRFCAVTCLYSVDSIVGVAGASPESGPGAKAVYCQFAAWTSTRLRCPSVAGFVGGQAGVLQATENGLQVAIGEGVHRNAAHASLIGNPVATLKLFQSR